MLKSVILMGGPQKGTRFRPLSFDRPKPLFAVAGIPMIEHLIKACTQVPNMKEILLIGFYQCDESLSQFISSMIREYNISIRYLQEYTSLGTVGGIYHFRDQIRLGDPEAVFLINGDVCGEFSLNSMLEFHRNLPNRKMITVMATEATRQQSLDYGCIVEDKSSHEMLHYVEKPSSFVSTTINCGVYLFTLELFHYIANIFRAKHNDFLNSGDSLNLPLNSGVNGVINEDTHTYDCISLEEDVLMPLSQSKNVFVFRNTGDEWWSQIKTAGSAIHANRNYLKLYRKTNPELLSNNNPTGPTIIGDVFIHPSASVDPSAIIGPNVSISEGVKIGAGVRIRESIILRNATIKEHSLVMHSIVGWNCSIGLWSRVEGTPCDPNPNKAFAKMENKPLFNGEGKLNPLITVLGSNVQVSSEIIVLNSIVLPYKELNRSYKNEIIL